MEGIALLAFLFVISKFITKRLRKHNDFFKSADVWLMKKHKIGAIILIIAGILHGISQLRHISRFGILPYILGLICILSIIGAISFFYLKKKLPNVRSWVFYHRLCAVTALITLFAHIMLAKVKF